MASSRETSEASTDEPAIASELFPDETDRLVAELRAWGIDFLTGGRDATLEAEVAAHRLAPADLLCHLAACSEPSVRDATIALLLLHPELGVHLPSAISSSPDTISQQLEVLALAAVYLQREWRTR